MWIFTSGDSCDHSTAILCISCVSEAGSLGVIPSSVPVSSAEKRIAGRGGGEAAKRCELGIKIIFKNLDKEKVNFIFCCKNVGR